MKELVVVGAGRWGQHLVREFHSLSDDDLRLTTVVTASTNRHAELQQTYPTLRLETDYNQVLANSNVQAVVIATPTSTHFDFVKKALKAGKHVFAEKPPTQTTEQLDQLRMIAQEKDLVLFTDNIYLYHPLIRQVGKLLRSRKTLEVRSDLLKWGTFNGDIFEDLAYHDIYTALYFFGVPHDVRLHETRGYITQSDVISFSLFMNNGIEYVVHIDRAKRDLKHKSITFKTEEGLIVWTNDEVRSITLDTQESEQLFRSDQKPLTLVCLEFLRRIKARNKNPDFALTHDTLKIVQSLKESAKLP